MTPKRAPGLRLPVVDFLDTSVFVEILNVPHLNAHHDAVVAEMTARNGAGVRFVLPTTTVVETGNHIFQIKDGAARRDRAKQFMTVLRRTADGEAPWVFHERTWDRTFLRALCDGGSTGMDLLEHAVRQQLGTGDLAIVAERDLFASRVQADVRIWTLETTMGTWAELPRP
ncbi:hypothetical protein AB0K51_07700 [Kitasatospora sp. NPDC049285]|uniref:hypothetical protein n=1 Tax=Kitasatospora sp. NPDC049285 TaxID=3157096 RepID=UPI00343E47C2